MKEDIREVGYHCFQSDGGYIDKVKICVSKYSRFSLQARWDGKWWLMGEYYSELSEGRLTDAWGPVYDVQAVYRDFQDVICEITNMNGKPEDLQKFLEEYLKYNAKQMAKIARKV